MKNIKELCTIVREISWNSFLRIFHFAIYSLRSLRSLRLNNSPHLFLPSFSVCSFVVIIPVIGVRSGI